MIKLIQDKTGWTFMIKLIQDKTGWTFAVLKDDSHQSKWCEELQSITTDPTVMAQIVPLLKPGDTVVDVGAMIGDHTVAYAKAVGSTGKVLAFEPYLPSYVCLEVNCRDLPQVELYQQGLGRTECRVLMHDEFNVGATHIAGAGLDRIHSVTVRTLDNLYLTACDFVKIDVEGYEPHVLEGAKDTIQKFRPTIFIELNDGALSRYGFTKDDVLRPLLSMGYEVKFIGEGHDLTMPQLDVFLLP